MLTSKIDPNFQKLVLAHMFFEENWMNPYFEKKTIFKLSKNIKHERQLKM